MIKFTDFTVTKVDKSHDTTVIFATVVINTPRFLPNTKPVQSTVRVRKVGEDRWHFVDSGEYITEDHIHAAVRVWQAKHGLVLRVISPTDQGQRSHTINRDTFESWYGSTGWDNNAAWKEGENRYTMQSTKQTCWRAWQAAKKIV